MTSSPVASLFSASVMMTILAACGGDKGSGPTSTSPTPTVTAVSITPATDLIKIKAVEPFSASATYADGRTASCEATWRSDNTSIATVTPTGRVTGQGSGESDVTAECQGIRGSRRLRVVPDYQGSWSGSHRVATCTDDGDWHVGDFCKELMKDGPPRISQSLDLTQDRDSITGTGDFGGIVGPVDGTIRMTGHLLLTDTTLRWEVEGFTVDVRVTEFESLSTDNERMTGQFVLTFRHPALKGSARVTATEAQLRKSTATLRTEMSGPGFNSLLRGFIRRTAR